MIKRIRALIDVVQSAPRALVLGIAGGIALLLIGILAVLLIMNHNQVNAERAARELAESFAPLSISGDELFLPDQPDFLPGVMLHREVRENWTAEDAAPYWTDMLEGNRDFWLEQVKSNIDELMENIP